MSRTMLSKYAKKSAGVGYVAIGAVGMVLVMAMAIAIPSALVIALVSLLIKIKPFVLQVLALVQVSDFGVGVMSALAFFSSAVLSAALFRKVVFLVQKWTSKR